MQSKLTGMGLLTHVQHPLERLGELVEAEKRRQRALVIAERWRIARAVLAGASVGSSVFATAVVSYAMFNGDQTGLRDAPSIVEAAAGPHEGAVPVSAPAPPHAPEPVIAAHAVDTETPAIWTREAAVPEASSFGDLPAASGEIVTPHAGISLQAQAMASLGEPLPSTATPKRPLAADVTLEPAEAQPQIELTPVVAPLQDLKPISTLILTGLPQGSSVESGVDLGDGTIVIAGDRASDIDVKLPDRVRDPVRAEVEMVGPDGAQASRFALTIRPSTRAPARLQRAVQTDDEESGAKPQRKKKRSKAQDVVEKPQPQAQPSARPPEWRYSEQPTYLGRGDGERRARRDREDYHDDNSLTRQRRPHSDEEEAEPRPSRGWSLFGMFGQ